MNKHIHCAFISHLHEDHVNGFEALLDPETKIDQVVLPYFDPIERAYLLISSSPNDSYDPWYIEFMTDPISYFVAKPNVGKVIVVGRGEGQEGSKPNIDNPEINKDKDQFMDFDNLLSDDELKKNIASKNEPNFEIYDEKVKYINHNKNLLLDSFWFFRFFNYKIHDTTLLDHFRQCIEVNFGEVHPIECVTDKDKRQKLKQCYDPIKEILKHDTPDPLNNTSLLLFHGPVSDRQRIVYDLELPICVCLGTCPFHRRPAPRRRWLNLFGHLLTGDTNFNFNLEEIEKHFSAYRNSITLTLIPHHGASKHWSDKILEYAPNCFNWTVSSRLENNYGHPAPTVIHDIVSKNRFLSWATEVNEVKISGDVYW